ncbi:MAG: NAD(P)H-dependent oxidoreductase [Chitinophagales bacterium]|nr:NAD(P)H-dependent oxidoreductase [Chitinophagales bacterium]
MITLFHGTPRPNSQSRKVANYYDYLLGEKNVKHFFFTLENVDKTIFTDFYNTVPKNPQLVSIEEGILQPTTKYIFIIPEYNGSFPGTLKAFIDATDVKSCFHGKRACITGVAAGRAGNLRGIDQFSNILHHLKMEVMHLKLPLSAIDENIDANGNLINEEYKKMIDTQIDLFLKH